MRVLRGTAAVLTAGFSDHNGEPVAPAAPVTVTVTNAAGSALATAQAATVEDDGTVSYTLAASLLPNLTALTAVWTDADARTVTTTADVVGGFYFSILDARTYQPTLANDADFTDEDILRWRAVVEDEVEEICGVAFVPRYAREAVDGNGDSALPLTWARPTVLRSARTYTTATAYTAFTDAQVAAVRVDPAGTLRLLDGDVWASGTQNILVEYEHGRSLPEPLKAACCARLRTLLQSLTPGSATLERATSVTEDGVSVNLASAGAYETGFPDIDAVYSRYSERKRGGDGPVAYSRPFDFDPQWWSVFHGGRR